MHYDSTLFRKKRIFPENFLSPLLLAAVIRGDYDEIQELLNATKIKINKVSIHKGERMTLLSLACQHNKLELIKTLLRRPDINPNIRLDLGWSPLLLACKENRADLVKLLLADKRTNPNLALSTGMTPLILAAMSGNSEIIRLLLNRIDTNPNLAQKNGITPLFMACSENKTEAALMLIEKAGELKLDLNKGCHGASPYEIARRLKNNTITDALLAAHIKESEAADTTSNTCTIL